MGPFYDLKRLPGNGFLIFPLSMSRLACGQDPSSVYEWLEFFKGKITEQSIDVIILYTNTLYFNSEEKAYILREKTNNQMMTHKRELSKLINHSKEFSPKAIHFIPWDSLILSVNNYVDFFALLQKKSKEDLLFKIALEYDMKTRPGPKAANYHFLFEDLLVTYFIRQKIAPLPYTLTHPDGWRLIVYPGNFITSDIYMNKQELLPINHALLKKEPYSTCLYDIENYQLMDYNKITVEELQGLWRSPLTQFIMKRRPSASPKEEAILA